MKFAKTIRFDKSDLNIFPLASEEGELAVVGTFNFYNLNQQDLKGKIKQLDADKKLLETRINNIKQNED